MKTVTQSIFYGDSLSFRVTLTASGESVDVGRGTFSGSIIDGRTKSQVVDFEFIPDGRDSIIVSLGMEAAANLAVSSGRYTFFVKYTEGAYAKTFMTGTLEVLGNG